MEETRKEEQSISINEMEYLPVTKSVRESMRVQKTEYIRQQMRKRQEHEDALMVQLLQEQRVIDGLQQKINENLEQTEASSRYNKEFKESMNAQIYALHGISEDKLEGMREYRNAYYQGSAFSLFLLSAALIVLCGVLHGFQSEICVFMLAYTGIEGALLAQGTKRWKMVDWLCKLLYLLIFPAMMTMFVCYELDYPEYDIFLPYATAGGVVVLVFATISYFLYSPYRKVKKQVREAKNHIGDIEKIARKEVRKNQKIREKEEKKADRRQQKEDRRQERQIRVSKKKESRYMHREGDKAAGKLRFWKRHEEAAQADVKAAQAGEEAAQADVKAAQTGEEAAQADVKAAQAGEEVVQADAEEV